MRRHVIRIGFLLLPLILAVPAFPLAGQGDAGSESLDERVRSFLEEHETSWRDMNIPARDGKFLHDLILRSGFTSALEIGTSTGHSAIWIAWALSKTGGRLITIEIDEERYQEALRHFREAGLSEFIDARLADAHALVRTLPGPFDFVFCDADKEWNRQYFIDVAPKMTIGGCYTTHNVSGRQGRYRGWVKDYVDYLRSRQDFETRIDAKESTGISISCKTGD